MTGSIGSWNIRGLNLTSKQKEIKNLIKENNLSVMAILETQVQHRKIKKIGDAVFGKWSWISNKDFGKNTTRILIGWDAEVFRLFPIDMNDQIIHCKMERVEDNKSFFGSFIYAANKHTERRKLWESLQKHKIMVSNSPWMICGDFNVALELKDISCGSSVISRGMSEFMDCINEIEVQDLNSAGLNFTWNQKPKTNDGVFKKIDRVMGNCDFLECFAKVSVKFKPFRLSDHYSMVINFPGKKRFKIVPFKFVNILANNPDLKTIVDQEWKNKVNGHNMFQLAQKLKALKRPIRKLLKNQGNVSDKINQIRKEVDVIQEELERDPFNEDLKFEAAVYLQELNMAYLEEESILKQKAKISWLKEGDCNSKFFHNFVKGRINRGRIETVMNEEGKWLEGEAANNEFVEFFKKFLGSEYPCSDIRDHNSLFTKKLDLFHAVDMVRAVSNEEIKEALFDIEDAKSPGPDGFTSKFFKAMWSSVGDLFCKAVKEFFEKGELLKEWNATVIALIPKVKTPGKVGDFRPISCCTVVYKCISKILVSRIRNHLSTIVSDNQSAFIPGRSIIDNVLLSQELVRGYHRNRGTPRCTMKVDIQKAYDTVNWNFLENILIHFGFHHKMIKWIMKCVTTPSFMISINGNYHGFFNGK